MASPERPPERALRQATVALDTGGQNAPAKAKHAADALQQSPAARVETRTRVAHYLDLPAALASMLVLMLVLLQFSGRVQPWNGTSAVVLWIVWGLFIVEFIFKLLVSPDRRAYMATHRQHLLVALVPPIGVVRLLGSMRRLAIASIHLLLPTSPNVSPYIAALKKRKLGQLALTSAVVILIGGTAEYFFEAGAQGSPITSFGQAVWWSAATATTVANQLYPVTTGGEIVGFLMMVYAVCVFGYLASSLASVLVAGDAQQASPPPAQDEGAGGERVDGTRQDRDGTIHLSDREIQVLRSILTRLEQ